MEPLATGANVAVRETWRGRVWRIAAARFVGETDGTFVLWHPERSTVLLPFADGRELRVPGDGAWRLARAHATWETLALFRPGARHTLYLHWQGGKFVQWYVNFERDSVRRGACFDILDEKLDLVVSRDGSVVVKDEDELEEAARVGYLDASDVRAEMERVLAAPPWPTGWEGWRPDPSWPEPQLPEGWDVV